MKSAHPRVCPHRQSSAARSRRESFPTQTSTVNHRRIEHRFLATRSAFEVEPRLPASSLLLWASPAQAKQTLLQKRRRVDAPCVGFPSRRARVQAEPTSCRRSECGWAAGKPVAGARHAVRRRCGSQGERLWLAKKVEKKGFTNRIVSHFFHPSLAVTREHVGKTSTTIQPKLCVCERDF